MKRRIPFSSPAEKESYQRLIASIQRHAPHPLSQAELTAAARNLIVFYKTLLEIHRQVGQNSGDDRDR